MTNEWPNILIQRAFNPTDQPCGIRNYDLSLITPKQKEVLSRIKIMKRKENELYLYNHPEIKGLLSILVRQVS